MLTKVKKLLLDLFFPVQCVSCGKEGAWICKNCFEQIKLQEIQSCPVCKKQLNTLGQVCEFCRNRSNLQGVFVVAQEHQKTLRTLIHKFKYNFFKEISTSLGDLIIKNFSCYFLSTENLLIIPVPLHPKREKLRGFNQSLLLGSLLGSYTNLRVLKNTLLRIRHTKAQMKLKRNQRLENLKDAFQVVGKLDPKQNYLLIDDVLTTGSTLEACAKALRKAGAVQIWGLVLSRGT